MSLNYQIYDDPVLMTIEPIEYYQGGEKCTDLQLEYTFVTTPATYSIAATSTPISIVTASYQLSTYSEDNSAAGTYSTQVSARILNEPLSSHFAFTAAGLITATIIVESATPEATLPDLVPRTIEEFQASLDSIKLAKNVPPALIC